MKTIALLLSLILVFAVYDKTVHVAYSTDEGNTENYIIERIIEKTANRFRHDREEQLHQLLHQSSG
jgi:hypothetical protein